MTVRYKIYDHTGKIQQKSLVLDIPPYPNTWNDAEEFIYHEWKCEGHEMGFEFDLTVNHHPDYGTIGIYEIGKVPQH